MKREHLFTWLWAGVLAFALSAGAAGCLATAFGFSLSWQALAALAGIAFAAAGLCRFSWGESLGLLLLVCSGVWMWQRGSLSPELDALVHEISRCYSLGYGWPVVGWIENRDPAQSVTLPFLFLGSFVVLSTARVVARRGRSFWAIASAAPMLALCIVLNDTVPAVPYLILTLFALFLLLLTQSLRRRDPAQSNRLAAMLTLPLAGALLILFAAIPQGSYTPPPEDLAQRCAVWFQELELGQNAVDTLMTFIAGIGKEKISLHNTGPRGEQKYKVMEVHAETSGTLYLRGRAYDVYDGKQWIASEGQWSLDGDYPVRGSFQGDVEIHTQSAQAVLYSPVVSSEALREQFDAGHIDNPQKLKSYCYPWFRPFDMGTAQSSYILSRDGTGVTDLTCGAEALMEDLAGQYLALPADTREAARQYLRENMPGFVLNPMIEPRSATVPTFIAGKQYALPARAAGDVALEANCIADLVRACAPYDLDTPKMPLGEDDFAMWFLNESDTGYCVHFATAATVLLRAAGIPARYVEGYMVSVCENKTVAVLGEDAHAWVEYWVPGCGWQLLEATPGYGSAAPTPTEPEETTQETTLPEETESETTARPDIPDSPTRPAVTRPGITEAETDPTEGSTPLLPGIGSDKPQADLSWLIPIAKWLGGLALAAAALWGQWKLRLTLRLRKLCRGTPNEKALEYWRQLRQLWKALKLPADDALEALALKAKFSQHILVPQELEMFSACRAALLEQAARRPLPARLWYRLVLALY